jgi:hypothetical protein
MQALDIVSIGAGRQLDLRRDYDNPARPVGS